MIDLSEYGYIIRTVEGKDKDFNKGIYIEIEKGGEKHIYNFNLEEVSDIYSLKEIPIEEIVNGGIVGNFTKLVYIIENIIPDYLDTKKVLKEKGVPEEKIEEYLQKEKERETLESILSKENVMDAIAEADLKDKLKMYYQMLYEKGGEKKVKIAVKHRLKEYIESKEKAKAIVEYLENERERKINEIFEDLDRTLIDAKIKYPENGLRVKYKGESYAAYYNKDDLTDIRIVLDSNGYVETKKLYKINGKIYTERNSEKIEKEEFLKNYEPMTIVESRYFEYIPEKELKKKVKVKRKNGKEIMRKNYEIVKRAIEEDWSEEELRKELKGLSKSGEIMLINAYRKAKGIAPIKIKRRLR